MENKNPIVTIEMENGDKMVAELYPHIAPNTVNNFISLVKDGYYDGIIFHRVIKGFNFEINCEADNAEIDLNDLKEEIRESLKTSINNAVKEAK